MYWVYQTQLSSSTFIRLECMLIYYLKFMWNYMFMLYKAVDCQQCLCLKMLMSIKDTTNMIESGWTVEFYSFRRKAAATASHLYLLINFIQLKLLIAVSLFLCSSKGVDTSQLKVDIHSIKQEGKKYHYIKQ